MTPSELEELPSSVQKKKISVKKAVNKLAEYIFKNPGKFGLLKYDEDFRSQLIICFLEQARTLFARYNKNYGAFLPYLYIFVRRIAISQLREKIRNDGTSYSLCKEEEQQWEYKINQYSADRFVAENEPEYLPEKTYFHRINQNVKNYCVKDNAIEAKTAMVLALKSSYFLSDSEISKVSNYCGVGQQKLKNTLARLNRKLKKKAVRHDLLVRRRDNAYYYHQKYGMMIERAKNEMMAPEYQVKNKYEKHTAKWISKNEKLQNYGYRICPTNKTVARVLGICERQVSYYISRVRKRYGENQAKAD